MSSLRVRGPVAPLAIVVLSVLTAWLCNAPSMHADSFPISGTHSSVFTDPVDGYTTNAGTRWVNAGRDNSSTLSSWSRGFTADVCEPFVVGCVVFYNGGSDGLPTAMTFRVTSDYTTHHGERGSATFDFEATLEPKGDSSDTVTMRLTSRSATGATIGDDGSVYFLELLGFTYYSNAWGGIESTRQELVAEKNEGDWGNLWGRYRRLRAEDRELEPCDCQCESPSGVSEPTAGVIAMIGLGCVYLRRRFR